MEIPSVAFLDLEVRSRKLQRSEVDYLAKCERPKLLHPHSGSRIVAALPEDEVWDR
jgi:hypothetical protein